MTVGAIDLTLHSPGMRVGGIGPAVLTLALLLAGCGGDGGGGSGPPDNPNGDEGTVAFQITPDWDGGEEGDGELLALRDDGVLQPRLRVLKNGKYLRVIFTTVDGEESEVSLDISEWASGEVHSIAATWGDGSVALYADGMRVGSNSYAGSMEIPPGTPLVLGSDVPPGGPDGAVVRDFELFRRPLDDSEIDAVQNGGVRLTVDSAAVEQRGDEAEICVHLRTGGAAVAGTQNDLRWSDDCARIGECRASGAHGKSLNSSLRGGAEHTLHALVLSITDVNPIPDGPLYCCSFRAKRDTACCSIGIEGARASDPSGGSLPVAELSGSICAGA